MILHSLELENFGRFVDPVCFRFEPGCIHILAGPNGSGKSTVLAALSAAFVIPHRSMAEDIRRWQPWGRDLAPRVAVEFSSGRHCYRLSKTFTFSNRARAVLERLEANGYVPVCEADAVEQQIPVFLGGNVRPGVDARTREWLLAGVLWARQNGLAELQIGAAVQDSVRSSLGAQLRGGWIERLMAEARRLYETDWTPTGKLAKASEVKALAAAVAETEMQADTLRSRLKALDELREELDRLQMEKTRLGEQFLSCNRTLQPLGEQCRQRDQLVQQQTACGREKALAEQESRRLQLILSTRSSHAARAQAAAQRKQQAETVLEEAKEKVAKAEEASRKAREQLAAEITRLNVELRNLNAPPMQTITRLESLAGELRELQARLEGALLHAEIVPECDFRLEVVQGEPQGALEAKPGQPLRISGSPVIEFRIPGTGSFRLSGPAQSAGEIRAKLQELQSRWRQITAPFGADSLDELKRRREAADQLELQLERLREQATRHDAGQSEAARAVTDARGELLQSEAALRAANAEWQSLEQERRTFETEPMDDAQVQKRLDELALRMRGMEQELGRLEEQLRSFPADLEQRFDKLKAEVDHLSQQLETTECQLETTTLRLAEKQGEANYSALAEREAELEEKRRQLAAAQLRADANKLLHQTLEAVFREAENRILPQLANCAADLYNEITAGFAEAIGLEENTWLPAGVTPAGGAAAVSPELLSGGEQEQLHLAVRLALADLLTQEEPFPVILDDVLLATDDARLGRVLQLLEVRRQRMQFLILTCHPERFRALKDVREFHLQSAARAAE